MKKAEPEVRKAGTVPHRERRKNPVGVDPRRERRQQRAAERIAKVATVDDDTRGSEG